MKSRRTSKELFSSNISRAAALLLAISLAGCGGGGNDSTFTGTGGGGFSPAEGGGGTTTTGGGTTSPTPPTEVLTKNFTFENFPRDGRLTVVSNYQPPTETPGTTAEVLVALDQGIFTGLGRFSPGRQDSDDDAPVLQPACGTADAAIMATLMAESPIRGQTAPSAVRARYQELPAGAQKDFYLLPAFKSVTAQKVLEPNETVHCTIFAELDDEGKPCVSRDKALYVAEAFDSNNPYSPGTGIYDQDRAVFGSEWNQNPPGGNDGDTKVVLFFFRSATLGTSLYGYTSPADSSPTPSDISNMAEIVYVNADKSDIQTLSTLAHEFQHLINQNEKVIRQGTFPEDAQDENVTINEGLSELAEEICGFTFEAGNTLLALISNDYLRRPEEHEFFDFFDEGVGYGQGYLFFKYVREHFGDSTIRAITTSTAVGMQNLNAQIPIGFAETFRRWTVANYATNLNGPVPEIYRYPSGFRTDGDYPAGQLVGVRTLPMGEGQTNTSGTLGPWSVAYLTFKGGDGTDLQTTVRTAPGSPIGVLYEQLEGTFKSLQQ